MKIKTKKTKFLWSMVLTVIVSCVLTFFAVLLLDYKLMILPFLVSFYGWFYFANKYDLIMKESAKYLLMPIGVAFVMLGTVVRSL